MTSLFSKRSKRSLSDDESEGEGQTSQANSSTIFPSFLVIQSEQTEKPMTKVSPFVIEKQLSAILGTPKAVKKLKNGNLLVECHTKQQAQNLLKTKTFFGINVRVFPHSTLNSSKGVIRCKDLENCKLEEIKEELKSQGVTDVRRISIWKDQKEIQTNTYVLSFNSSKLPSKVKAGYQLIDVRVYIPNPLRCYICQKFGHHEDKCRSSERVCMRCAEQGHQHSHCSNEVRCSNCGEKHQANSKSCFIWKKEKEILKIKYTENVSFFEARQLVEKRLKVNQQNQADSSYANITKPKPAECASCKLLVEQICTLFPEKEQQIRNLLKSQNKNSEPKTSVTDSSSHLPKKQTQSKDSMSESKHTDKQKDSSSEQKSPSKPVKQRNEPKQKISLPAHSINKNMSTDSSSKSKEKKKLSRLPIEVTESNEVAIVPIPTSPNKYNALEDMEGEDVPLEREESSWNKPRRDSWDDSSSAME